LLSFAIGCECWPYGAGTLFDYMARIANYFELSLNGTLYWVHHAALTPLKLLKKKYPQKIHLMHLKGHGKRHQKRCIPVNADVENQCGFWVLAEVDIAGWCRIQEIGNQIYVYRGTSCSRVVGQVPKV